MPIIFVPPKVETRTRACFLPPNVSPPPFCSYVTRFINSPPFIFAESFSNTVKQVMRCDPNASLRNAHLEYSVRHQGQLTPTESTSFAHPKITAGKFQELLQCCHPKNNHSTEDVKKCWTRVFPGITRSNLDVPSVSVKKFDREEEWKDRRRRHDRLAALLR